MIRFDGVHKRYPEGHEALKGVSFAVDKGELVFLTGHSGAGKSSLLRLVMRLERPSRGRVRVAGHDIDRRRDLGLYDADGYKAARHQRRQARKTNNREIAMTDKIAAGKPLVVLHGDEMAQIAFDRILIYRQQK